jgi:hypothetical protein
MDLLMVIPAFSEFKRTPEYRNLCTASEVTKALQKALGKNPTETRMAIRTMGSVGDVTLAPYPDGRFWNNDPEAKVRIHRLQNSNTVWKGCSTTGVEVYLTLRKPPMLDETVVKRRAKAELIQRKRAKVAKANLK